MSWLTRTLGDICDEVKGIIRTGPFGSQLHQSDYRNEGLPVIMPKDISDSKVSVEGIARIGDEDVKRLAQHRLQKGDIVYGRRGDIGRRALITEREAGWLCGTGCLRISLGSSIIDPVFLYYYLGESKVIAWIYNQAIGATLPNLNTTIIRSIPVSYPPLSTQLKIVAILSAYDRLIENNTRRIKILEEMARSLYDEWFVKFRFPSYEQTEMVDSDLGLIPEGWAVEKLGNIAVINRASIKTNHAPEEINYIDIASVSTGLVNKIEFLAFADAPSRARRIVKHGDIIWSTVRPNRRSYSLILNPQPYLIVSTGFAVISAEKVPYTYLYHTLTTDDFVGYLTNNATGSAYPAVKSGDFKNADVLLPRGQILEKFHNIIESMFLQKHNLQRKNANLRKTRDLLLPKLISGEIDVENLDIETGVINGSEEISSSSQEAIAG